MSDLNKKSCHKCSDWQASVEALKAEQAAELKWPDGATHYAGAYKEWDSSWYIIKDDKIACMLDDGNDADWDWREIDSKDREELLPRLIHRPTERAVESGNNGLPPLGSTVRIVDLGRHIWHEAKRFIGSDCTLQAVFMTGDTQMVAVEHVRDEVCACFRADMVRTIEQSEHEERMAAAYAMCAIAPSLSNVDAVALYDAFYRKQVAK